MTRARILIICSVMALPARILDRLPAAVTQGSLGLAGTGGKYPALSLGFPALDTVLPDRGLLRGGVIELAVVGRTALATSLSLAACASAQAEGRQYWGESAWCAFIDPSHSLYAPSIRSAGVQLDRLLVVRPAYEDLSRVALRVVESGEFSLVVIDALKPLGTFLEAASRECFPPVEVSSTWAKRSQSPDLRSWTRVVRRLSLSVEGSSRTVLLVTDKEAKRTLPLPVAMRIELHRPAWQKILLQITKDRLGRLSPPREIPLSSSEEKLPWSHPAASDIPLRKASKESVRPRGYHATR